MKIRFLIILFFCPFFFYTQTTSLVKGEVFEHPKKYSYTHPVEQDENARYFFESEYAQIDGTCLFYKINVNDGKLLFKVEVTFDKKADFVAAYNKAGKILLFTRLKDRKAGEMYLLLREFDNTSGAETGQTKVVSRLSLNDEASYERNFILLFSPDSKKLLVVAEERGKKTAPEIAAKLFEVPEFKTLWEKKAVTVFENSPVYTFNYIVNNNGVFTYLFAFFRSNSQTDIAYGIGIIPENNYQNKMIKIPAGGRSIYNPVLECVENTLVCSGEFFEGEDKTKKTRDLRGMGFFFLTADESTAEITTQSFEPLGEEFKTRLTYADRTPYYSVTGVNGTSYANKNYRHYRTVLLDGNFYVIKHHSYILLINNVPTTTNKEVIVMKYNGEKKLEWTRMIPRSSYSNGVIDSQLSLVCTKKLNFFFYEHPKNQALLMNEYNPKKYRMQIGPDEKSLVLASIDDSGNIHKQHVVTETTFYLNDEFEKTNLKSENKLMGRGDTESRKTRRYDSITVNDQKPSQK